VDGFFTGRLDELLARLHSGPMQFRLILQPTMAVLFGIRDGIQDAKAGRPPLIWSIVFGLGDRKELVKGMLRRLPGPILVATLVDAIVQYLMFGHVRPLMALLVGVSLMATPYSIARSITNRIVSKRRAAVKAAAG
jgi:hypothetical protein